MTDNDIKTARALIQHANIADPRSMDLADALRHALAHIESTRCIGTNNVNVKDAVERACQNNSTLHNALASVAIWETCRIVEQALRNTASGERGPDGSLYDTVFGYSFLLVLERWAELHPASRDLIASTAVFGGDGPGQPSGNAEHAPRLRYVGWLRGAYEMVGCTCGLRCDTDAWIAHVALVLR